jgi:ethanolamine utilization protein EutQ (cupin superfamily)
VIFQGDFDKWANEIKGIQLAYDQKQVIVEGEIKVYRDSPEMIVHGPAQIEVVRETK